MEDGRVTITRAVGSAEYPARFMRVARTIADLEESQRVMTEHVVEALAYRIN